MNITLNKESYQVNSNEFNTIIHNEYNNLRIRENLGFYERIASLLKDLSPLAAQCLFFSQSHGGYLGCRVARHYDKVYFLNNQEKHAENLRTNVAKFGLQNVDFDFSGDVGGDGMVIFSEDYSHIDEEIISVYRPFILTTVCKKLIKNLSYAHVYEKDSEKNPEKDSPTSTTDSTTGTTDSTTGTTDSTTGTTDSTQCSEKTADCGVNTRQANYLST